MKKLVIIITLTIQLMGISQAQVDTLRITSYNILNFPGSTGTTRLPHFRTVVDSIDPDILVVQELISRDGQTTFLNEVMNHDDNDYMAAPFVDGHDTDNGLFYKHSKINLLSSQNIITALRDISEYVLSSLGVEFRIYSVHLKASQGVENENKRLAEATILRNHMNDLSPSSNFMVVGDYNFYDSDEAGFDMLSGDQMDNDGRVFDPINQPGNWHNTGSFASIHTQSPRTTQFGGGAPGGLDDRFDLILVSNSLLVENRMDVLPDTYTAFGNDGAHFNLAVNDGANSVVSIPVANALHDASDHLPVFVDFKIDTTTSVSSYDGIPTTFILSQNFPNPFNPETTITFTLPKDSQITLKIIDVLGKEVMTLIKGLYNEGSHNIIWDGSNDHGILLPNGIYFYKLQMDSFQQVRKMILIR